MYLYIQWSETPHYIIRSDTSDLTSDVGIGAALY